MKKILIRKHDGIYSADIDISIDEWKDMLTNKDIFNEASKNMVIDWYNQPSHQATWKEVLKKNQKKCNNPYNGIVTGLGKRIIKHLNRFEIYYPQSNKKAYYVIPFIGWYIDYDKNKEFIWKVRNELIIALEELNLVNPTESNNISNDSNSYLSEHSPEGKKISFIANRYERNAKNRQTAIKIHGTTCSICGFNFEKVYGQLGKGYIEVHHIHSLAKQAREVNIIPQTDLICVCANCHRMIHRNRNNPLLPETLKQIIKDNKLKN